MRDPEAMLSLLQELSEQQDNRLTLSIARSRGDPKYYQSELLVDAGHAAWVGLEKRMVLRITNDGFDFLNAVDKQDDARGKFLELLRTGATYVNAAQKVIELFGSAG